MTLSGKSLYLIPCWQWTTCPYKQCNKMDFESGISLKKAVPHSVFVNIRYKISANF